MFDVPTPIGVQVTISYAMFDVPTLDPNRIKKVTISYSMFDFPTDSVDL